MCARGLALFPLSACWTVALMFPISWAQPNPRLRFPFLLLCLLILFFGSYFYLPHLCLSFSFRYDTHTHILCLLLSSPLSPLLSKTRLFVGKEEHRQGCVSVDCMAHGAGGILTYPFSQKRTFEEVDENQFYLSEIKATITYQGIFHELPPCELSTLEVDGWRGCMGLGLDWTWQGQGAFVIRPLDNRSSSSDRDSGNAHVLSGHVCHVADYISYSTRHKHETQESKTKPSRTTSCHVAAIKQMSYCTWNNEAVVEVCLRSPFTHLSTHLLSTSLSIPFSPTNLFVRSIQHSHAPNPTPRQSPLIPGQDQLPHRTGFN